MSNNDDQQQELTATELSTARGGLDIVWKSDGAKYNKKTHKWDGGTPQGDRERIEAQRRASWPPGPVSRRRIGGPT